MFYYVITIEKNEKYFSYVRKIKEGNNIISLVDDDVIVVYPCKRLKDAKALASLWNGQAKKNGNYMFELPKF